MRYDQNLDVDMSFQNTEPLPNTQLLRAYARLSPVVRHLVLLIKAWAKGESVCGAKDGNLSSYTFTLMTIYFLQVDPMVKLPTFPTDIFTGTKSVPREADVLWDTHVSLKVLLIRFFEFYATAFHWGHEVVSVRIGTRYFSNNPIYSQLPGRDSAQMILVEDPYLLQRNLNCVLGMDQYKQLWIALSGAWASILKGQAPMGLQSALEACQNKISTCETSTNIPESAGDSGKRTGGSDESSPKGNGNDKILAGYTAPVSAAPPISGRLPTTGLHTNSNVP
jgi:terminal uridylyltransferase